MPIDFSKTDEENRSLVAAEKRLQEQMDAQSQLFADFASACMFNAAKMSEKTFDQIPKDARYVLIFDSQMGSYLLGQLGAVLGSHAKLIGAINKLAIRGWRCVGITAREKLLYALMERLT